MSVIEDHETGSGTPGQGEAGVSKKHILMGFVGTTAIGLILTGWYVTGRVFEMSRSQPVQPGAVQAHDGSIKPLAVTKVPTPTVAKVEATPAKASPLGSSIQTPHANPPVLQQVAKIQQAPAKVQAPPIVPLPVKAPPAPSKAQAAPVTVPPQVAKVQPAQAKAQPPPAKTQMAAAPVPLQVAKVQQTPPKSLPLIAKAQPPQAAPIKVQPPPTKAQPLPPAQAAKFPALTLPAAATLSHTAPFPLLKRVWIEPRHGELYLQLAALDRKMSDDYLNLLASRGFHARASDSPKEGLYRILMGPFKTRADLEHQQSVLHSLGLPCFEVFY